MKPILFSPLMAEAILAGRKNQTRRLCKPQPIITQFEIKAGILKDPEWLKKVLEQRPNKNVKPRISIGDILYVREEHYRFGHWIPNGKSKTGKSKWRFIAANSSVLFGDNKPESFRVSRDKDHPGQQCWYKRNSLFMPKDAARIFLKITKVRLERACDISYEDAVYEGIEREYDGTAFWYKNYLQDKETTMLKQNPVISFKSLWDSINGFETWEDWVFVYNFERT